MEAYRIGQRVCRLVWRDGHPHIEFATVTQVCKPGTFKIKVNGGKKTELGWSRTIREALDAEYLELCRQHGVFGKTIAVDWTIRDTVRCICRVRRLESRIKRRYPFAMSR